MLITKKLGYSLSLVIIMGLLFVAGFFIANNYYTSKMHLENNVVRKEENIITVKVNMSQQKVDLE